MDSTIPMAGKRKRITLPTSAKPFLREKLGVGVGVFVLSWFKNHSTCFLCYAAIHNF